MKTKHFIAWAVLLSPSLYLHASEVAPPALPKSAAQGDGVVGGMEALERDVSILRREINREEREARIKDAGTNVEVAERVLKREQLFAKQRALAKLRRSNESSASRAERYLLQERLATAGSAEERAAILDQHVALQQTLASEKSTQSQNR